MYNNRELKEYENVECLHLGPLQIAQMNMLCFKKDKIRDLYIFIFELSKTNAQTKRDFKYFYCYASNDYFCKQLKISKATLKRYFLELEKMRFIERYRNTHNRIITPLVYDAVDTKYLFDSVYRNIRKSRQ